MEHVDAHDPSRRDTRRASDDAQRFGDGVAEIVDACTDSYEDPPPPWHIRKQQYIEHLHESSPSALRVSLADKVDNVEAILRDLLEHEHWLQPASRARQRRVMMRRGCHTRPPDPGATGRSAGRVARGVLKD